MLENATSFSSFSVDDIKKAKEFYENILGLKVKEHEGMGLEVFTAGTSGIFVYPKGDQHTPATFTVLNFIVDDLDKAMDELIVKGITFEQYDNEWMKTNEREYPTRVKAKKWPGLKIQLVISSG